MQRQNAFSLVELSIVLVILGLLTGGVLAGQSLIRAAELRSVAVEESRYVAATRSFQDKYFALPGDMANAQSFWGVAAACPGDSTTPSTTQATCNGDGDGIISTLPATHGLGNEMHRFWQHLANAGLIEGSYSGVAESPNGAPSSEYASVYLGRNAPKSKLPNAGWQVRYTPDPISIASGEIHGSGDQVAIADVGLFDGTYGNTLFMGTACSGDPGCGLSGAILKPEEAWNIDTKLDDGKPATGFVRSYEAEGGTSASNGCSDLPPSSSVSRVASNYSLANTAIACGLIIILH